MAEDKAGNNADMKTARDCGEGTGLMEPLVVREGSRHRPELTDLALELAQRSAGFRRRHEQSFAQPASCQRDLSAES
jgi:hypothetical protein